MLKWNLWQTLTQIKSILTHLPWIKWPSFSQTTFSNAFSWMQIFEFRLKLHWSVFLWDQLTIFQHLFRWWLGTVAAISHYLNQWWPDSLKHICGTRGGWVNTHSKRPRIMSDMDNKSAQLHHIRTTIWILGWKLDESTARRQLKSPQSLSGRSIHLTLVTKWSWSWSWMTYCHPLCAMSIGPPILKYSYFKIWPWKSTVKVMCVVKSQGHVWP